MVKAKQASAVLEFTFENVRDAEAVRQALMPEEALPPSTRCKAWIKRRKNILCLQVEALDTAALRAALNSFIRWVIVARDMIKMEENKWKNYRPNCATSSCSSSRHSNRHRSC